MQNNDYFIKNIEIKNFKCFNRFELQGFARVNLIGGKNNVGKTALMEACHLSTNYHHDSKKAIDFYEKILEFNTHRDGVNLEYSPRYREEDLINLIKSSNNLKIVRTNSHDELYYTDIRTQNNQYQFSIQDRNTETYTEKYSYRELMDLLDFNIKNTKKHYSQNFIVASSSYPNEMFDYIIGEVKRAHEYQRLNDIVFDLFGFKQIDIIQGIPVLLTTTNNYIPLKDVGQGIKSFIYNTASLLMLHDEVMCIDEIENGLHYSLLDTMWEIMLVVSKKRNIQLFATTHSKESIESYARVARKIGATDIAFIELCEREYGVKAFVYPYEWFLDEMEQGHEVRGCL